MKKKTNLSPTISKKESKWRRTAGKLRKFNSKKYIVDRTIRWYFKTGDSVGGYDSSEQRFFLGTVCWVHPEYRFFCIEVTARGGSYKRCFAPDELFFKADVMEAENSQGTQRTPKEIYVYLNSLCKRKEQKEIPDELFDVLDETNQIIRAKASTASFEVINPDVPYFGGNTIKVRNHSTDFVEDASDIWL